MRFYKSSHTKVSGKDTKYCLLKILSFIKIAKSLRLLSSQQWKMIMLSHSATVRPLLNKKLLNHILTASHRHLSPSPSSR
jgi:hypothetical protein